MLSRQAVQQRCLLDHPPFFFSQVLDDDIAFTSLSIPASSSTSVSSTSFRSPGRPLTMLEQLRKEQDDAKYRDQVQSTLSSKSRPETRHSRFSEDLGIDDLSFFFSLPFRDPQTTIARPPVPRTTIPRPPVPRKTTPRPPVSQTSTVIPIAPRRTRSQVKKITDEIIELSSDDDTSDSACSDDDDDDDPRKRSTILQQKTPAARWTWGGKAASPSSAFSPVGRSSPKSSTPTHEDFRRSHRYLASLDRTADSLRKAEVAKERSVRKVLQQASAEAEQLKQRREREKQSVRFPPFDEAEAELLHWGLEKRHHKPLVSAFNIDLRDGDIKKLRPGVWLNDELINFYMQLLPSKATCKIHVFNTFFFPFLRDAGYAKVRTWTRRKVDLFSIDKVLVPIHLGNHWTLAIINIRDKQFEYYDSFHGRDPCLSLLRGYLESESLDKKQQKLDTSGWKMLVPKDIPKQDNGYDCGVFTCQFARCCTQDKPFDFKQENMPYLRQRMVIELLNQNITT